jgi:ABC-type transport system involved in multi-copper enzyme maturation permease subunit
MIWVTWRQHRAEAAVGTLIVAALATAMVIVGSLARERARGLGLPECATSGGDCGSALDQLHRDFHTIPPFTAALIAIPLLAGMFWAAPLVSREYESGTHRLAWTQSVSPLRWITMKVTLIFAITASAALALGVLATWTLNPLSAAFGGRYNSTWYDTQGIVPVACILFALSVGIAASALIRRTIPAMAVTLIAYAAVRIPIHFIRGYFWATSTKTTSTPLSALLQNPDGDPHSTFGATVPVGSWALQTTIIDPSGHPFRAGAGNRDLLLQYCPKLAPRGPFSAEALHSCAPVLTGFARTAIVYQPASHFWLVQTVESALFLALAAVLVGAALFAISRRRPS